MSKEEAQQKLDRIESIGRPSGPIRLSTAFAERDLGIEVALVEALVQAAHPFIQPDRRDEFLKAVHAAVDEAGKDWLSNGLNERYGDERADRVREQIGRIQLSPDIQ